MLEQLFLSRNRIGKAICDAVCHLLDKRARPTKVQPAAKIFSQSWRCSLTPFDELAPAWLAKLMADLGLTREQAAGILGNLGFESGGFKELQELHPLVEGSTGGLGVAQWTGPRRVAFEAWAKANALDVTSDAANYGYLLVELRGDYRHTVDALKAISSDKTPGRTMIDQAVWSVGQTYERPYGTTSTYLPGFNDRLTYAMRALAAPSAAVTVAAAAPAPPAPDIGGLAVALGTAARNMQTALAALGYDPGPIDGIWGKDSQAALERYRSAA